MSNFPRITFGMIVLNGEPFLRYNLRALYPFAHEIIVVEGAVPAAAGIATPDGHSTDGTLETLRNFKAEEDPEDKVVLLTAEDHGHPNGFWPGEKDEQSQAYATQATGDYLWQVDVDEFYLDEDMERIISLLESDPSISGASFRQITFWGSPHYVVDGWYLRRGAALYRRLFRWGPGHRYVCHRPPTVIDERGRNLLKLNWMDGNELAKHGVCLYHYSLLLPKQVMEKCVYYSEAHWARQPWAKRWAEECYFGLHRPFRVHNVFEYPSWLERFEGEHPEQFRNMWRELNSPNGAYQPRPTHDVERLLSARRYRAARPMLKYLDYPDRIVRWARKVAARGIRLVLKERNARARR